MVRMIRMITRDDDDYDDDQDIKEACANQQWVAMQYNRLHWQKKL